MTLSGGKRKVNKSLKAWVSFVKKVQKEEKLSYKDAIHRAKVRKDKGEKWMSGGAGADSTTALDEDVGEYAPVEEDINVDVNENVETSIMGGRGRSRSRSRSRRRTISKSSKYIIDRTY